MCHDDKRGNAAIDALALTEMVDMTQIIEMPPDKIKRAAAHRRRTQTKLRLLTGMGFSLLSSCCRSVSELSCALSKSITKTCDAKEIADTKKLHNARLCKILATVKINESSTNTYTRWMRRLEEVKSAQDLKSRTDPRTSVTMRRIEHGATSQHGPSFSCNTASSFDRFTG